MVGIHSGMLGVTRGIWFAILLSALPLGGANAQTVALDLLRPIQNIALLEPQIMAVPGGSALYGWTGPAPNWRIASKIENILAGLVESYKRFDLFFARNGIVPVNITYEQIAAAPVKCLELINLTLGLEDLHVLPEQVRIERQAGPMNTLWRKQFRVFKGCQIMSACCQVTWYGESRTFA